MLHVELAKYDFEMIRLIKVQALLPLRPPMVDWDIDSGNLQHVTEF